MAAKRAFSLCGRASAGRQHLPPRILNLPSRAIVQWARRCTGRVAAEQSDYSAKAVDELAAFGTAGQMAIDLAACSRRQFEIHIVRKLFEDLSATLRMMFHVKTECLTGERLDGCVHHGFNRRRMD